MGNITFSPPLAWPMESLNVKLELRKHRDINEAEATALDGQDSSH